MGDFDSFLHYLKQEKQILRISVLGDGAVGKTTLIQSIINSVDDGDSKQETSRTPFMEIETWIHDGISIQAYDLAGQRTEGAHPVDLLPDQIFGHIDIILLVFSLHRYESFSNLDTWMQLIAKQIETSDNGMPNFLLIGNKSDKEQRIDDSLIESVVSSNQGISKFLKTSAQNGAGIDQLISEISSLAQTIIPGEN